MLPTIVIERCPGGYSVTLRDHATRQQITVESLALEELAEDLEKALRDAERPWVPFNSYKVKDPTKRRKLPG